MLVKQPVFKRICKTVNESVKNRLSTRVDNKRLKIDPVQHFLYNIVNGEFNNRADVKDWYAKIIFYDCEEKVRNINSNNARKMMNIYDQLRKNFITPSIPSVPNKQPDVTDEQSESKESTKQQGLGLKILTPQQMLSRLPISLTQLKAGNNSQRLRMK